MSEHNLIQSPELLYKIAKRYGLRQPHILPALNEGIQAVIICDDLTRKGDSPTGSPNVASSNLVQVTVKQNAGAGNDSVVSVQNFNTAVQYRLVRAEIGTPDGVGFRVDWGYRDSTFGAPSGFGVYTNSFLFPGGAVPKRVSTLPVFTGSQVSGNGAYGYQLGSRTIGASPNLYVIDDSSGIVLANGTTFIVQSFNATNVNLWVSFTFAEEQIG